VKQDQTLNDNKKTSKAARMLRTLGIILLCLVLALYVLFPVTMGAIASLRSTQKAELPPDGFEAVTLTAEDGTVLACWYASGENGAAIILVHGAKSNLASLTQHAMFLREAGYGVLALTLRGHGGSGGRGNAFGWQCGQDVAAAVDFLQLQGVERSGALGLSMGSEVLLGSAADEPAIAAIVADGASQRSLADYLVPESNRSLWHSWTTRLMYASVRLFTGQTPPERTLLLSITDAKDTRFLLIAAETVEKEPLFGGLYHDAVPERSALWVVPNTGHTQGLTTAREEYVSRVIAFFNDTLLIKE
jgi:pimeloyl-ACP methyl ester carboxylesterase